LKRKVRKNCVNLLENKHDNIDGTGGSNMGRLAQFLKPLQRASALVKIVTLGG